ncbi:hypothetical protein [Streptomyces sp. A1547]|uniref:hypothetical protein n=1 Tax=Streptomyces sp. A1547 TaxID=2563105 RepID=UPI00061F4796|nr:hypothetical protein [Streptomyces sp. A1547]KJY36310.1 hypothetical protein VR46_31010 [Streptomyces sp. NRRL S-444]THA30112.1 hypothetical protein E6W17_38415 [Streptomyces sp. A1547]
MAMGALLVLTGCGSGGDEAPVSWKRPCDMLPKAVVEKSVGVPLVAAGSEGRYGFECRYRPPKSPEGFWTVSFRSDTAGTYCTEPKSQSAPEIDADAYKIDDNGRVVVGGPYHGHCLRIAGYSNRIDGSEVTVASALDLLRTARGRME